MNPAALKANLQDMPPGSHAAGSTRTPSSSATSTRPATRPTRSRMARWSAYRIVQVPMTSITLESTKGRRREAPCNAERSKNFFGLLGLLSWMYTRPIDPIVEWINERFGSKATVRDANLAAFKAGYHFGETAELFDHPWEVLPARPACGALSQHHRQRRPRLRPEHRSLTEQQAPDRVRVVPDHAGVGHPPRALVHKNFGVRTLQAEDEIGAARRAWPSAPRSRAPRRHHRDQRPGHGLEGREHGARGQPRAAAHRRRRAARWPVDGAAHEDRAVRPAPRHVRPPR